jgi:hypothetical protein
MFRRFLPRLGTLIFHHPFTQNQCLTSSLKSEKNHHSLPSFAYSQDGCGELEGQNVKRDDMTVLKIDPRSDSLQLSMRLEVENVEEFKKINMSQRKGILLF